jgi:hypothetical protein
LELQTHLEGIIIIRSLSNLRKRESMKIKIGTLFVLSFCLLASFWTYSKAPLDIMVLKIYGSKFAKVKRTGKILKVTESDLLHVGDIIGTQTDHMVEILFGDGSTVMVKEKSQFKITGMKKIKNFAKWSFDLIKGTIHAMVNPSKKKTKGKKFTKEDINFVVKTKSGVVGVKGTEFSVTYGEDGTTTTLVLEGEVWTARSSSDFGKSGRFLALTAMTGAKINNRGIITRVKRMPASIYKKINQIQKTKPSKKQKSNKPNLDNVRVPLVLIKTEDISQVPGDTDFTNSRKPANDRESQTHWLPTRLKPEEKGKYTNTETEKMSKSTTPTTSSSETNSNYPGMMEENDLDTDTDTNIDVFEDMLIEGKGVFGTAIDGNSPFAGDRTTSSSTGSSTSTTSSSMDMATEEEYTEPPKEDRVKEEKEVSKK